MHTICIYSLRRGRLEPKKKEPPSLAASKGKIEPLKSIPARLTKREPPPVVVTNFSRTDCGRFSMRTSRPLPQVGILIPN